MATYPGSYVPLSNHSIARINEIIDALLTPRILCFRQITIFDEPATLMPDGLTFKVTYGNWNETFDFLIHKNGKKLSTSEYFNMDYVAGKFDVGPLVQGDWVNATYNFDMFPQVVLVGFIYAAIETINSAAVGPPTSYTVETMPAHWDGVVVDLVYAHCMEKLMLCQNLWSGKLIYAIPDFDEGGGGDIAGNLETLKRNAEDRAYKSLENELFKVGQYQSPPTQYYYQAIRNMGGGGPHSGSIGYGKFRGWKPRRWRG
jgi:hypothetical protein